MIVSGRVQFPPTSEPLVVRVLRVSIRTIAPANAPDTDLSSRVLSDIVVPLGGTSVPFEVAVDVPADTRACARSTWTSRRWAAATGTPACVPGRQRRLLPCGQGLRLIDYESAVPATADADALSVWCSPAGPNPRHGDPGQRSRLRSR